MNKTRMCGEVGCNNHADVPNSRYWCKDHGPKTSKPLTPFEFPPIRLSYSAISTLPRMFDFIVDGKTYTATIKH